MSVVEGKILEKHTFETATEDSFTTMKEFVDPLDLPVETPSIINRASAKKMKIPLKDRTTNFLDLIEKNDETRSLGREDLRRQRNNNN